MADSPAKDDFNLDTFQQYWDAVMDNYRKYYAAVSHKLFGDIDNNVKNVNTNYKQFYDSVLVPNNIASIHNDIRNAMMDVIAQIQSGGSATSKDGAMAQIIKKIAEIGGNSDQANALIQSLTTFLNFCVSNKENIKNSSAYYAGTLRQIITQNIDVRPSLYNRRNTTGLKLDSATDRLNQIDTDITQIRDIFLGLLSGNYVTSGTNNRYQGIRFSSYLPTAICNLLNKVVFVLNSKKPFPAKFPDSNEYIETDEYKKFIFTIDKFGSLSEPEKELGENSLRDLRTDIKKRIENIITLVSNVDGTRENTYEDSFVSELEQKVNDFKKDINMGDIAKNGDSTYGDSAAYDKLASFFQNASAVGISNEAKNVLLNIFGAIKTRANQSANSALSNSVDITIQNIRNMQEPVYGP